jgi:hypothetical protein
MWRTEVVNLKIVTRCNKKLGSQSIGPSKLGSAKFPRSTESLNV